MSFNFCTSAAIIRKAGAAANTTIIASGSALAEWCSYAEQVINSTMRYDFITNISLLNANTKQILGDVASSLAAMQVISYDMDGYTSLSKAQTMLDVQRDMVERGMNLLKDKNVEEFLI